MDILEARALLSWEAWHSSFRILFILDILGFRSLLPCGRVRFGHSSYLDILGVKMSLP